MVKWTIFIAAYTAGCIWLSMRRMEASGTGPMTPAGAVVFGRWAGASPCWPWPSACSG